jgi:hypothetical protein
VLLVLVLLLLAMGQGGGIWQGLVRGLAGSVA